MGIPLRRSTVIMRHAVYILSGWKRNTGIIGSTGNRHRRSEIDRRQYRDGWLVGKQ